ncbi:MAG: ABC-2 family transporter protein [Actinobacteria bacterium]|nr:ABC-2 family transporter protein [Actinomycetota bacterium]
MRLSFELARRGYRRYAAYPGATYAGLFTNLVFGFLIAYILLAVYEQVDVIGGYDVRDAIAYVWISQGLLSVVAVFGPSWYELARRVQRGDVATDLQRPLDVQHAELAQDVGRAGYQLVWRAVPQFFLGALLFEITVPGEPLRWLAFAVSVALAVAVSFGIRFLLNLCSFWLLDYRGPVLLALAASNFLSGAIIPLAFLPEPLDTLARLTPFASMLQAPVDVYVGEPLGGSSLTVLALQTSWAVGLLAAGRLVLGAGTRKLVLQGG